MKIRLCDGSYVSKFHPAKDRRGATSMSAWFVETTERSTSAKRWNTWSEAGRAADIITDTYAVCSIVP